MAGLDTSITFDIELDDGSVKQVRARVQDIADQLEKALRNGAKSGIDRSLTGIAVQLDFIARAAGKAFGALSGVLSSAVHEAVDAENAMVEFSAALANSGRYSASAVKQFEEFAKGLQSIGTVSDDAVIKGAAALVSIGRVSTENLPKATKAAVDLAAGLNIDLQSAFDLVSKAATGNVSALQRYGIKVDEGIPRSEKFANVLKQIGDRFGGLDEAKANTFGGALEKLNNTFNDLLETIGGFITRSPSVTKAINVITSTISKIGNSVTNSVGNADPFKSLLLGAIDFGESLTALYPTFNGLYQIAKVVLDGIVELILHGTTAFTGFAALGAGALNTLGLLSDEAYQAFKQSFEDSALALEQASKDTEESISKVGEAFNASTPAVSQFWINLRGEVEKTSGTLKEFTETARNVSYDVQQPFGEITDNGRLMSESVRIYMSALKTSFADFKTDAEKNLRQVAQTSFDVFAKGVSGAFVQVGKNIAQGKALFAGFGQALLSTFGDIARHVGEFYIKLGIAKLAASAGTDSTGYASIAAGVALNVLSGILGAAGGGGGGGGSFSSGGVDTNSLVAAPNDPLTDQPQLDRNRKSEVSVNIHGNVLDRKETGLEIANVLQEFFDKQDGVLVRG